MNRFNCLPLLALLFATPLVNGCRSVPASVEGTRSAATGKRPAPSTSALSRAHAHYSAGVLHELHGEQELAVAEFRRALNEDPDAETLILDVTRRLLVYKRTEEALDILKTTAARKGASGEIFARLGSVQAQLGRLDEALAANQSAVKKSPLHLPGYQNLLACLLQAKRSDEALRLLDAAARVPEAGADFLAGIADLYEAYVLQYPSQREAVNARALALLRRAAAMKTGEPELRLQIADGLYQLGEGKEAAEIYLPLLDQVADLPVVRESIRSKLVEIFLRADDRVRARELLESVSRDDPSDARAYYLLGSIAYDEKRWKDATELLQKTLLFSPNFERAYYDLAAAQLAADDAPAALATLARARGKFPANFLAEYLTGLADVRTKNYSEAAKHFTQAEAMAKAGDPRRLTADFYFEIGVAFERSGERAEAVRAFERALELRGDFPEAQNYLGYMWAEKGENLDRARELIEKALKAEPKSAAYLDSMAWVLYKLNQPKAALEYMLQAVQLNEQPDATLYDHLGDVYAALNETEKAREAWRKSLAVEDSPVVRQKVEPLKAP